MYQYLSSSLASNKKFLSHDTIVLISGVTSKASNVLYVVFAVVIRHFLGTYILFPEWKILSSLFLNLVGSLFSNLQRIILTRIIVVSSALFGSKKFWISFFNPFALILSNFLFGSWHRILNCTIIILHQFQPLSLNHVEFLLWKRIFNARMIYEYFTRFTILIMSPYLMNIKQLLLTLCHHLHNFSHNALTDERRMITLLCCIRTYPQPFLNPQFSIGIARIGTDIHLSLMIWKLFSHSLVHLNRIFFLVNCVSGMAIFENSWTNLR